MTASPPSPETGSAPDPDEPVVVALMPLPGKSHAWAAFCIVFGALLIAKLATVAQWIGAVLVGLGVLLAVRSVLGLVFPAGVLRVDADAVSLPRGRNRPGPVRVPRSAVTAAYLLRHATPWMHTAPVLVVEAAGRAYLYPRDYFASESDQRRVVDALTPHG